ncbi:hypothetical protein [Asticcacaulis sp. 201]|uniref:hypothetical protein n=1 Tax=Asticcacaulis sp. 201 TaxID=3028787 RepID=UPI0029170FD4|nr:hypothetical protein [Asticcacaulis sp. 201]MDV6330027.1 hypothetical protein [Asticcacaulis sp. 201]
MPAALLLYYAPPIVALCAAPDETSNAAMPQVTVYQFKLYDPLRGEWIPARRWGTVSAILRLNNAYVLRETATRIDAAELADDFDGFTPPTFVPVREPLTPELAPATPPRSGWR